MRKEVPIWQKVTLSIEEAAAYSGIGMQKLREIAKSQSSPNLCVNCFRHNMQEAA